MTGGLGLASVAGASAKLMTEMTCLDTLTVRGDVMTGETLLHLVDFSEQLIKILIIFH